jgi:hypothetical protein
VIPVWLTTVVEKFELVETCNPYDVAPVEAFQLMAGVIDTPVAPLAGEDGVGGAGTPTVVKLRTGSDQALVPPALLAFTRQ